MKLTSMTDFVLEQFDLLYKAKIHEHQYITRTKKFADFLKQPLELWMFVPCDENGEVLEEPVNWQTGIDYNYLDYRKYQQAKERCIFKNIEYVEAKKEDEYSFLRITELGQINYPKFWKGVTIEDLVKYNLELTPTVIKRLGL